MEYKSLSKLIVLIIFLGLLQGYIFAQDIQLPLKADSIACDTFPPPRWLDGYTSNYIHHLWWLKPEIDAITPINLLGYKLYLNGDSIDQILFFGEDTSHYFDTIDFWFPPGFIEYHVSALYEQSPCGLPGAIEESSLEGPLGIYGYPEAFIMTFIEDWNTGSFDPNLWIADEYWYVNGPYGHPYPCATYSNFPDSAYRQSLISYWINTTSNPISGTQY
ncbi:MAG: hypothetical protein DRI97_16730, partial [Bacteroidetes bacterium]